jgi:hypothetical protein
VEGGSGSRASAMNRLQYASCLQEPRWGWCRGARKIMLVVLYISVNRVKAIQLACTSARHGGAVSAPACVRQTTRKAEASAEPELALRNRLGGARRVVNRLLDHSHSGEIGIALAQRLCGGAEASAALHLTRQQHAARLWVAHDALHVLF